MAVVAFIRNPKRACARSQVVADDADQTGARYPITFDDLGLFAKPVAVRVQSVQPGCSPCMVEKLDLSILFS